MVASCREPYDLQEGGASLLLFSREEARPHVLVQGDRGEAKYWLQPQIVLAQNFGLSRASLAKALRLIREHEDEIRAAWKKHFRR